MKTINVEQERNGKLHFDWKRKCVAPLDKGKHNMANTRVIILEGSNGQCFFLKETLLTEGLSQHVDLVSQAEQAISLIYHSTPPYDLVVINLAEAWEQGVQLGFWLSQKNVSYPIILIAPPETDYPLPLNTPFCILSAPLSLHNFAASVRAILQSKINYDDLKAQIFSNLRSPDLLA